uniref:Secreted protein n=1 Tax=Anguilla anguilla TaxID=7936 RepID=A0A0E9TYT7_ANGAN
MFFFWNFLNCDWMATAAFSVSGAPMSMSISSDGTSFLDASCPPVVLLFPLVGPDPCLSLMVSK